MRELFDSFSQYLSKRAKSQLYGIFGFWWVVFHWAFFYSLLFLSQDIIFKSSGMLKDAYLKSQYFNVQKGSFWFDFIAPFAMTYATIKWFPKLILWAYKIEKNDDFARQEVKFDYEKKVAGIQLKAEEKKADTLDAVINRVEKEKDIVELESSAWDEDFKKFKADPAYRSFEIIIQCIYEFGGRLRVTRYNQNTDRDEEVFSVPSGVLAFVDGYDLINIDNVKRIISFTDKGRYFVRLSPFGR